MPKREVGTGEPVGATPLSTSTAGHVEEQRKGRMVASTGMWGDQKSCSQAQHTG